MVKAGLIPKLVELLKRPPYRARGLRLLYHMSIDDRCKAMFAYTDVSFRCPALNTTGLRSLDLCVNPMAACPNHSVHQVLTK